MCVTAGTVVGSALDEAKADVMTDEELGFETITDDVEGSATVDVESLEEVTVEVTILALMLATGVLCPGRTQPGARSAEVDGPGPGVTARQPGYVRTQSISGKQSYQRKTHQEGQKTSRALIG